MIWTLFPAGTEEDHLFFFLPKLRVARREATVGRVPAADRLVASNSRTDVLGPLSLPTAIRFEPPSSDEDLEQAWAGSAGQGSREGRSRQVQDRKAKAFNLITSEKAKAFNEI